MPECSCGGANPNCFKCGGWGWIGDPIVKHQGNRQCPQPSTQALAPAAARPPRGVSPRPALNQEPEVLRWSPSTYTLHAPCGIFFKIQSDKPGKIPPPPVYGIEGP